jgi:hypothetical protein
MLFRRSVKPGQIAGLEAQGAFEKAPLIPQDFVCLFF